MSTRDHDYADPLRLASRPGHMLARRRSRLRLGRLVSLRYLSHRRYMAKVCFTQGMQRIRPGLWYDLDAGVSYIQSDDEAINGWAA